MKPSLFCHEMAPYKKKTAHTGRIFTENLKELLNFTNFAEYFAESGPHAESGFMTGIIVK